MALRRKINLPTMDLTGRPLHLIFMVLLVSIPPSWAKLTAQEDEEYRYWQSREEQASKVAHASYVPDPYSVTNSFNQAVNKALQKKNTGRSLKPVYSGPCKATNPIDRCWRCNPDWASNRQKLASCAKGFGRKAWGGGKHGKIYVVTDDTDNNMMDPEPGTLRHAVTSNESLWIIFDRDMSIELTQELIVADNKTIDGRGHSVHIAGGGQITIQFVSNVIIHNLHIHDNIPRTGGEIRDSWNHIGIRGVSDGDGVSIFGSSNIWLDHLTLANCKDGLIDAVEGSTAITISNCFLTHHDDTILLGASDAYSNDSIMQVTLAFNHFGEGLVQRMPRVRWGFAHVVNNDYTHWIMYAIGGSMHPTIVSQGNRFIAPDNPFAKEVTKRDYAEYSTWKNWNWTSEGDLLLNGAYFNASGVESSFELRKGYSRKDVFRAKPGSFVTRLTRYAGALDCKVGMPC